LNLSNRKLTGAMEIDSVSLPQPVRAEPVVVLAATVAALAWSAIGPYDSLTWWLEVAPVLIAIPILIATYRRHPLSPLLYRLVFLHALILIVGGHYTYARVPAGLWLQEVLDFSRNHYDRLGHIAQGFVPAIIAREILLRATPLGRGAWLFFLVVSVCLAVSAAYELLEWLAALVSREAAESFLGTQGDDWDTQWDMFLALAGAIAALVLLSGAHDRSMRNAGITAGSAQ
jgi:putative membrane protein